MDLQRKVGIKSHKGMLRSLLHICMHAFKSEDLEILSRGIKIDLCFEKVS